MSKKVNQVKFFVVCLFLAFSMTGCDFISSIAEYFQDSKSKTTKVSPPATPEAPAQPADPANTLAQVGNWTITKKEFQERLKALKEVVPDYDINDPKAKEMVLEELVRQQLLVMDAEEKGVADNPDIKAATEEFRRTLIVRDVAQKLTKDIKVTDDEAKAFYEEQKQSLVEPAQWHVREIVLDTQLKANEVLTEVLRGVDFAETAKQNSKSATASKGGDLGFIDDVPFPEMANPLLSLKAGEVSSVFKGPSGYYIIKLEEKKGGEQISFEKIKEEIIQNRTLYKQQQVLLDYIENLKKNIPVKVNTGLL